MEHLILPQNCVTSSLQDKIPYLEGKYDKGDFFSYICTPFSETLNKPYWFRYGLMESIASKMGISSRSSTRHGCSSACYTSGFHMTGLWVGSGLSNGSENTQQWNAISHAARNTLTARQYSLIRQGLRSEFIQTGALLNLPGGLVSFSMQSATNLQHIIEAMASMPPPPLLIARDKTGTWWELISSPACRPLENERSLRFDCSQRLRYHTRHSVQQEYGGPGRESTWCDGQHRSKSQASSERGFLRVRGDRCPGDTRCKNYETRVRPVLRTCRKLSNDRPVSGRWPITHV